jgi:hypothetical protein
MGLVVEEKGFYWMKGAKRKICITTRSSTASFTSHIHMHGCHGLGWHGMMQLPFQSFKTDSHQWQHTKHAMEGWLGTLNHMHKVQNPETGGVQASLVHSTLKYIPSYVTTSPRYKYILVFVNIFIVFEERCNHSLTRAQ